MSKNDVMCGAVDPGAAGGGAGCDNCSVYVLSWRFQPLYDGNVIKI